MSEYCLAIERHLTKVNGGHLVRIVGAGFAIVREWALAGIPLSVVLRGIDLKAERHRLGTSHRPLRIEFCESDVRTEYDQWRRAVGVPRAGAAPTDETAESGPPKPPSLTKHLERVIDRLGRAAARVDLPPGFLDEIGALLEELGGLRDAAKGARGPARATVADRLGPMDARLRTAARAVAPAEVLAALTREAEAELAPFRTRLSQDAWQQAVTVTVDRLLRHFLGLPVLDISA